MNSSAIPPPVPCSDSSVTGHCEPEYIVYKGQRVRSRIRRVRRRVVTSFEKRLSRQDDVPEEAEEVPVNGGDVASKELTLNTAMDLSETLVALEREKQELEREAIKIYKKISLIDQKIMDIRVHQDFKTPEALTDLYADIVKQRKSLHTAHPFDPDFEDMPTLCATCQRVVSTLSAFPCHNCGFFVCERCLDKARQCPKCLMGNIDDYSSPNFDQEVQLRPKLEEPEYAVVMKRPASGPACATESVYQLDLVQDPDEGIYQQLEDVRIRGSDDSESSSSEEDGEERS